MRRWLVWLIVLSAVVAGALPPGGRTPPAAAADPLPAAVTVEAGLLPIRFDPAWDAEELASRNQSTRDLLRDAYAKRMTELAKEVPGWQCVSVGGNGRPRVELRFVVGGPDPAVPGDQTYTVSLSLTVQGQGSRSAGPFQIDMTDPEYASAYAHPLDALEGSGRLWIEPLMRQFKPCATKAKVKGQFKYQDGGVSVERSFAGDAELALKEDGSFDAVMEMPEILVLDASAGVVSCHATEAGGSCQAEQAACTWAREPRPQRLSLAGSYRDGDGSLVLTRAELSEGNSTGTATCSAAGVTFSAPVAIPAASGALGGGSELAVVLADGAQLELPAPSGTPGSWQMTLTLEYRGETGAPVSAAWLDPYATD